MTFDYWCIFLAFLLPYLLTAIAKIGSSGFDNHIPRDCMANLQGWRKRAYWAHLNGFEVFAPFAAAVIIAHQLHVSPLTLNSLAATFVVARILHAICYISDKAAFRSLVWFVGFLAIAALFFAAARV